MSFYKIERDELATILGALRAYQNAGYGEPCNRPMWLQDIVADDEITSLTSESIDDLCERLNMSDDSQTIGDNDDTLELQTISEPESFKPMSAETLGGEICTYFNDRDRILMHVVEQAIITKIDKHLSNATPTDSDTVLFRKFADDQGGDVIALFPNLPYGCRESATDESITSYQHIGQHGAASPDLITELDHATADEYASLAKELESAPFNYQLDIVEATS